MLILLYVANYFFFQARNSRASLRSLQLPVPVEMFSWSDGPGKFSVSTVDYFCLDQDNLLNDIIIDFYIRYVFSTKLSDELKNKCHVFSSFFYQSLTTKSKIGRLIFIFIITRRMLFSVNFI